MNFHGLHGLLRPLCAFLMHHDLLDKQLQQFRRQLRNVCVAFGLGDETLGAGNRIPQLLEGTFLRWDFLCQSCLLL